MTKRHLIVTADDFGRNADDDRAMVEAHLQGIVTSVSVFATRGRLTEASRLLEGVPSLRAGVHLDLSSETPTQVQQADIQKSLGGFSTQDLEVEFEAQIDLFRKSEIPLGHLDNHRSDIYFSPEHFEVCIKLASKYNVPLRTPFDRTFGHKIKEYAEAYQVPMVQVEAVYRTTKALQDSYGVPMADHFHILNDELCNIALFSAWLSRLGSGTTELCTHPGVTSEQSRAELALLCAPQVRDTVKRLGISLVGCGHEYP